MAELLMLAGVPTPFEPPAIFELLSREVPAYSGMDYESIGALGCSVNQPVEIMQ
jgi:hypothetical protein